MRQKPASLFSTSRDAKQARAPNSKPAGKGWKLASLLRQLARCESQLARKEGKLAEVTSEHCTLRLSRPAHSPPFALTIIPGELIVSYNLMRVGIMLEPDVIERIRTIFLHPRPHVSIAEATALLGWTDSEMSIAI